MQPATRENARQNVAGSRNALSGFAANSDCKINYCHWVLNLELPTVSTGKKQPGKRLKFRTKPYISTHRRSKRFILNKLLSSRERGSVTRCAPDMYMTLRLSVLF